MKRHNAVMGVDPGVRGGVAVLSSDGAPLIVEAIRPDMTHRQVVDMLQAAVKTLTAHKGYEAFVEKVGYMPGDGGKGANTFGRIDGLIRGALLAYGVYIHDAPPMVWQSRLSCLTGGNKNITKAKAFELFGKYGVKITHSTADALLIAEFGRIAVV